jgi:hypothetical protein
MANISGLRTPNISTKLRLNQKSSRFPGPSAPPVQTSEQSDRRRSLLLTFRMNKELERNVVGQMFNELPAVNKHLRYFVVVKEPSTVNETPHYHIAAQFSAPVYVKSVHTAIKRGLDCTQIDIRHADSYAGLYNYLTVPSKRKSGSQLDSNPYHSPSHPQGGELTALVVQSTAQRLKVAEQALRAHGLTSTDRPARPMDVLEFLKNLHKEGRLTDESSALQEMLQNKRFQVWYMSSRDPVGTLKRGFSALDLMDIGTGGPRKVSCTCEEAGHGETLFNSVIDYQARCGSFDGTKFFQVFREAVPTLGSILLTGASGAGKSTLLSGARAVLGERQTWDLPKTPTAFPFEGLECRAVTWVFADELPYDTLESTSVPWQAFLTLLHGQSVDCQRKGMYAMKSRKCPTFITMQSKPAYPQLNEPEYKTAFMRSFKFQADFVSRPPQPTDLKGMQFDKAMRCAGCFAKTALSYGVDLGVKIVNSAETQGAPPMQSPASQSSNFSSPFTGTPLLDLTTQPRSQSLGLDSVVDWDTAHLDEGYDLPNPDYDPDFDADPFDPYSQYRDVGPLLPPTPRNSSSSPPRKRHCSGSGQSGVDATGADIVPDSTASAGSHSSGSNSSSSSSTCPSNLPTTTSSNLHVSSSTSSSKKQDAAGPANKGSIPSASGSTTTTTVSNFNFGKAPTTTTTTNHVSARSASSSSQPAADSTTTTTTNTSTFNFGTAPVANQFTTKPAESSLFTRWMQVSGIDY